MEVIDTLYTVTLRDYPDDVPAKAVAAAEARYTKALENHDVTPEVRAVIQKQFDGVMRNHDKIKALRDAARAQKGVRGLGGCQGRPSRASSATSPALTTSPPSPDPLNVSHSP